MNEQNSSLALLAGSAEGGRGIDDGLCLARREILGDDTLLTIKQVADLVGCSQRQIYAMIHRHTFPGPRKLGVLSRWRLGVLKQWLRADEKRRC